MSAGPSTVKSKPQRSSPQRPTQRIQFSKEDDLFLTKFLAIENPDGADRMGNVLYEALREVFTALLHVVLALTYLSDGGKRETRISQQASFVKLA